MSHQPMNAAQKLINSHLKEGEMEPGKEIGMTVDQALLQDATGTLVMLELEAMGLDKPKTEVAVQYVDHNLLQTDYKNADDHVFLRSAAQRFGLWYSRPGNGVSHPVHQQRFGIPGKILLGSDSHTCAAGAIGMLAIGTGGMDVANAIAGELYYVKMPKIFGIELKGKMPDWVSAKDVILEMLRRYDVKGGKGWIFEYHGEGLKDLTAMDRHVIANMGAELGCTATVFPSDDEVRKFLKSQEREDDFVELEADEGAAYDESTSLDLSELESLIAKPSSPGKVVPVREVEGADVHQVVVGSSANPGTRDFWVVSNILRGKVAANEVSLDVNPTSRQVIENLAQDKSFLSLILSGARFHQAGCMGCIGMGQAPASGKVSLRTMPRNFPGRSGTLDDQVYLCSPETAAAAAFTGRITDPRKLESDHGIQYPRYEYPEKEVINRDLLLAPPENGQDIKLEKGPNIKSLPELDPLPESFEGPILLKMGDNVSTDEILRAGAEVLPFRSNLPEISKWCYYIIDEKFYDKAMKTLDKGVGHIVVAGDNYAQGSSREHAALAPRYLGQKAVIAKSYARIGWQNLVNFGIIPFEFVNPEDHDRIGVDDIVRMDDLRTSLEKGEETIVLNETKGEPIPVTHSMSPRQVEMVLHGGRINDFKKRS